MKENDMPPSKKLPVGLQLFSIRKECEKDLPSVLKAVAKMGYQAVEFAGYYGRNAKDLRALLDEVGLKCCGTHIGLNTLQGDALPGTIEFNRTLGNGYLIVPGVDREYFKTRDGCLKLAEIFNGIAQKLTGTGMHVGYHNHSAEFQPIGGELPWDIFFGATRNVLMQFDIGNAMHGGATATDTLRRYPGRSKTIHLKEYCPGNDKALIGEGDVPWKEVFALCESVAGTEWYVVEQESYACPPMECVEKCLQNLRRMGR
jgi:sugar phosphate isomerase/epimerase